jgi:hypothetical protein
MVKRQQGILREEAHGRTSLRLPIPRQSATAGSTDHCWLLVRRGRSPRSVPGARSEPVLSPFADMFARLAAAACCFVTAAGHGCITDPTSRNAVDAHEVSCDANTDGCSAKAKGDGCVNATHPGAPCMNGQASFWYSQGCFIVSVTPAGAWCQAGAVCWLVRSANAGWVGCRVAQHATTSQAGARPTCAASARRRPSPTTLAQ